MEVVKTALGEVRYIDCMDKERGLPSLEDNSFEFCFTDPVFNIDYAQGGFNRKGLMIKLRGKKVAYPDKLDMALYRCWCEEWFVELRRVCEVVVIYCGGVSRMFMWRDIEKPYGVLFLYQANSPNNLGGGAVSNLTEIMPLMVYGTPRVKLKRDTFAYLSRWGFLAKHKFVHTCPLNFDFWFDLISQYNPKSVLDNFVGSGTTVAVCEKLSIPYLCYEIDARFKPDLDWWLGRVKPIKKGTQKTLFEKET